MCRLVLSKSCRGRELEESSFPTFTVAESLLECTVLFHCFYKNSRFFYAEEFKAYSCIIYIYIYVFEDKLLCI